MNDVRSESKVVKLPVASWAGDRQPQVYDAAVPLTAIDDHPDNPPTRIEDLAELVASVMEVGVLTPVLLTPRGHRFLCLAGHRRRAAARQAGLATVPAIIRATTDQEALEILLVENLQRENLRPAEEARGLRRLLDTGLSQHEVAKRLGKAQGHISKRVALLALPEEVLREVDSGRISLSDAAELVKLAKHPKRLKMALSNSGPVYGDMTYKVSYQLREIEEEAKTAELVAKFEAKGVLIIPSTSKGQAAPKAPGMVIGKGWGMLDVDRKAHAKEPCHAVIIARGEAVACCVQPKRHPEAKKAKKVSAEDERIKRDQQALREAAKARRGWHAHLLKRGVGLDRLFALRTILQAPIDQVAEVARLLELETSPVPKEHGQKRHDAQEKIREALLGQASTRAGADRVLGALALTGIEREFNYGHRAILEKYFELLQVVGHQPNKQEQKHLQRKWR